MSTNPSRTTEQVPPSKWRRLVSEASGACGDLGTFLPHVVGAITVAGLAPAGVLVGFGAFFVASGLFYGLPMAVQPMKVVSAVLVTGQAGPGEVAAAGIALGLILLALGATGTIGWLARAIPQSVAAGLQLGLGLSMGWLGLELMLRTPWLGVPALALLAALMLVRRFPAAPVMLAAAIAAGYATDLVQLPHDVAFAWSGLGLVAMPTPAQIWRGFELLVLPQLPLTLTNAVIVTALVARDLFPASAGRASERNLALSTGLANLALAPIGAMPMCHGAGGVQAQHRFGARTGLAPDLCRHAPEPYVEIHPDDADALGLKDGALARVTTSRAEAVAVAKVSDRQRRGSLFMPMHWTDAFAPWGRANALVAPRTDPTSGQPEFKHTPARVRAYRETWKGFFLSRDAIAAPGLELVWRRVPQDACQQHEFAGRGEQGQRDALRKLLTRRLDGEVVAYEDAATGARREAWIKDGKLVAVLYMTSTGRLPPRDWLVDLFGEETLSAEARSALLFGRPPGAPVDKGPMVCACLKVGAKAVSAAIAAGAHTPDAVGAATGAGTNCGSCRPEIARMIKALAVTSKEPAHVG